MCAGWVDRWHSWGESLTNALTGVFDWSSGGMAALAKQVAAESGLPGMSDGPADALKHIALAAMLAMEDGSGRAAAVLNARENITNFFNIGTNSQMDIINNDLGIRIGVYLRERGGATRQEAIDLAGNFVRAAVKESEPCGNWVRGTDGLYRHAGRIEVVKDELTLPYPVLASAPACVPDAAP